ncbi:unnamed protein product [Staurois parvus]|uniref:Secreted protein n=1 Tax=Staurois parvus TaxID=386267 RepID=A0ABN9GZP9_9NEOB|nr:unnamed protein product [Staurois parvus]
MAFNLSCLRFATLPWAPPDSAMCHFQVSLHWLVGCCMAFHCCCLHRHPAPCASVVCSRC